MVVDSQCQPLGANVDHWLVRARNDRKVLVQSAFKYCAVSPAIMDPLLHRRSSHLFLLRNDANDAKFTFCAFSAMDLIKSADDMAPSRREKVHIATLFIERFCGLQKFCSSSNRHNRSSSSTPLRSDFSLFDRSVHTNSPSFGISWLLAIYLSSFREQTFLH